MILTIPLWFILSVLSAIFFSITTLLQKVFLRENDTMEASAFFALVSSLVAFIFAIFSGFNLNGLSSVLPNFFVMPFLYAGAVLSLFAAFKRADASDVTVLGASRSIWVAIGSIIFLGETLANNTMIGTLLVILGIVVISYQRRREKPNKGHAFALLAALLFGIGFVNDAYIINTVNVPSYLFLSFFMPAIILTLLKPKALRLFNDRKALKSMIVIAIFYVAQALAIFYAYHLGGQAAQVYPIGQSYVVLTVILAAIFLKERERIANKIVGTLLVFVGIVLI